MTMDQKLGLGQLPVAFWPPAKHDKHMLSSELGSLQNAEKAMTKQGNVNQTT